MTAPSAFARELGLRYPIVQGPMNGASPPALAVAVSNAGALGSCAAALFSPAVILERVQQIRAQTAAPFNINLFLLDEQHPDLAELKRAQHLLRPFREALGLSEPPIPTQFAENNRDQIAALLEAAPPVASFTFGVLPRATVTQFKKAGSRVIGTATTVAEARAWEEAGADFVCVSGSEAGGHRPTFLGDIEQSCVGLMALLPQVVAAVKIPVIAAGGIMNGRGIAAARLLGAQAAQLGTAFLCSPESGIAEAWRAALRNAGDDSTRLTRAFSGRPARSIVNDFMCQMRAEEAQILPYPVQNALTGDIRQAAAKAGRGEFMSLWAGQGVGLARPMPAAELVATWRRSWKRCKGDGAPDSAPFFLGLALKAVGALRQHEVHVFQPGMLLQAVADVEVDIGHLELKIAARCPGGFDLILIADKARALLAAFHRAHRPEVEGILATLSPQRVPAEIDGQGLPRRHRDRRVDGDQVSRRHQPVLGQVGQLGIHGVKGIELPIVTVFIAAGDANLAAKARLPAPVAHRIPGVRRRRPGANVALFCAAELPGGLVIPVEPLRRAENARADGIAPLLPAELRVVGVAILKAEGVEIERGRQRCQRRGAIQPPHLLAVVGIVVETAGFKGDGMADKGVEAVFILGPAGADGVERTAHVGAVAGAQQVQRTQRNLLAADPQGAEAVGGGQFHIHIALAEVGMIFVGRLAPTVARRGQ